MNSPLTKIRISVIKADLCPDREIFTKQHICCLISFRDKYFKTLSHHFCGNNPVWEEEFSICIGENNNILKFALYTETGSLKDSLIASGSVDLAEIDKKKWINLEKEGKFIGKLLVECFSEPKGETHHAVDKDAPIRAISPQKKRDWMENNSDSSLKDFVKFPSFVEAQKEDETKLAGLKNSKSTPPETTEDKKTVFDSIKDFLGTLVHKTEHHKEVSKDHKNKDVPLFSRSLSELMDKPICIETPAEKTTKLAGITHSQTTNIKKSKSESKSDELSDLLDKAEMKETKQEDSTKISGTYNTAVHLEKHAEKKHFFDKKENVLDSKQQTHLDTEAAHEISGLLEKESFEEARYQDGLKLGGTKNC